MKSNARAKAIAKVQTDYCAYQSIQPFIHGLCSTLEKKFRTFYRSKLRNANVRRWAYIRKSELPMSSSGRYDLGQILKSMLI